MLILIALIVAGFCGMIGAVIGDNRNRAVAGFWLGFLLGPFGCLAALFLPHE